jgi:hypothetical protein
MIRRTITLTDGTQLPVSTPSIFVAREVHKLDPSFGIMTPGDTQAAIETDPQGFFVVLLAALFTAGEPWANGAPERIWTPDEVAVNLGPVEYGEASNAAVDLLYDFWGIERPSDEEATKILAEKKAEANRPNPRTPSKKRQSSQA